MGRIVFSEFSHSHCWTLYQGLECIQVQITQWPYGKRTRKKDWVRHNLILHCTCTCSDMFCLGNGPPSARITAMSPVSSAVWLIRLRSLSFTNGCFPWSVNSFCYSGQVEFTSCVVSCVYEPFHLKFLKQLSNGEPTYSCLMGCVSVLSSYCLPDAFGVQNGIRNFGKYLIHMIFIHL
jgi:hypothetical protein